MKAAIVIDDWKLPVFERRLSQAGFAYEKGPGVTEDTLTLTVETTSVTTALGIVVRAANAEAAGTITPGPKTTQ